MLLEKVLINMFNVALVGIGNIGLLYDYDKFSESAHSHVKAIFLHEEFTLKYVVDIENSNLDKVQSLFPNVLYFNNVLEVSGFEDIDVLVIATPTRYHFQVLNEFRKNVNIKKIIMEKPLFLEQEEYENIPAFIKDKIIVNYIRRFDKNFQSIKKNIEQSVYGDPMKLIFKYTKGFKNNGSHIIDFINFMLPGLKFIESRCLNSLKDNDFSDETIDVFFKVSYNNQEIPIYILGLDDTRYSIFEFDLFFTKKRVQVVDFGRKINYFDVEEDPDYDGYKILSQDCTEVTTDLNFIMLEVYNKLFENITSNTYNISSFYDEILNISLQNNILGVTNENISH